MLDYLTHLNLHDYTLFLYGWGALGVLSALSLFLSGELPISSRKESRLLKRLGGSINKKTGWIIMEVPILITVITFYLLGDDPLNVSAIMVGAFVMHYTNRALIYPHRIKTEGKTMPVSTMLMSMVFYIINGYLIGHYFGDLRSYSVEWLADPRFILGAAMFLAGFAINIQSDNILIKLRQPGETGYRIPHGGFYRWVSCPNYFGEIVEWTGFAIMTWSLPSVVYALWVGLPLLAQALIAHKWYVEKFGAEYPARRKAIIPGLL